MESQRKLRTHIISDLHIDHNPLDVQTLPHASEIEICIIAGDISNRHNFAFTWLKKLVNKFDSQVTPPNTLGTRNDETINHDTNETKNTQGSTITTIVGKPQILLVLGNHDFYGSTFRKVREFWYSCELVKTRDVILLDNTSVTINNVCFFGCTYWTNMNGGCTLTMREVKRMMNDYSLIKKKMDNGSVVALEPEDTVAEHLESKRIMKELVEKEQKEKVKNYRALVIITHHLPSYKSIAPEYQSYDLLNPAFASHDDLFIDNVICPDVWVHGHTHKNCDYMHGKKTRVVCNPRGEGKENKGGFKPRFTIDI